MKKYRHVLLGSAIAGALAYMFMLTNKLPNHDDLACMFTKGASLSSGRWGLDIISFIFPDLSMPWIYGVLSILMLAAANCMLVDLFSIKNKILQFLTGALIVTYPSMIGTFGYMFTAAPYAVAFWMAVAAAYIVCKCRKRMIPVGMLLMIFSISIYQAYLAVAAAVLIVYAVYRIIATDDSIRSIVARGAFSVIYLIVSLGMYWIITNLLWVVSGETLGAYASGAMTFSFGSILSAVGDAYIEFFHIIFHRKHGLIVSTVSHYLHLICIALLCIELVLWAIRKKDLARTLLLAALLLILPLGENLMYIFVAHYSIHTLVLYSHAITYVLIAVVIEQGQHTMFRKLIGKVHALSLDAAVIGLTIILSCNIFCANQAYLQMHLAYENMYSFASTVVSGLQNTPGYTAESPVALVGDYPEQDFYASNFDSFHELTGITPIDPNTYSIEHFFTLYTGVSLNLVPVDECRAIRLSEGFASLPAYPDYGCITEIDGVFVVKMSDISPIPR